MDLRVFRSGERDASFWEIIFLIDDSSVYEVPLVNSDFRP